MSFPKYKPEYKDETRNKKISDGISYLSGENKKFSKHKRLSHTDIIKTVLDIYPKSKRLPLAWKT